MKLDLHMQIASYNILFDDEYVWRAISYRDSAGKAISVIPSSFHNWLKRLKGI